MLHKTGVPTNKQIIDIFVDKEILIKPKAMIECYEEIPCNPCSTCCPVKAISIGEDINQRPVLDVSLCTGCGICIYNCPGLAIMVVQIKKDRVWFKIPYEMLPLPNKGEVWHGVNRNGDIIGDALIEQVMQKTNADRTAVVTISIDASYLHEFITIRKKI